MLQSKDRAVEKWLQGEHILQTKPGVFIIGMCGNVHRNELANSAVINLVIVTRSNIC